MLRLVGCWTGEAGRGGGGGHRIAVCGATVAGGDWEKDDLGQMGPQMLGNQIKEVNKKWTQLWFL